MPLVLSELSFIGGCFTSANSNFIHVVAVKVRAYELRPKGKTELLDQVRINL